MVVGDLATNVEVLVLGGGPAGYAAALRAAELGRGVLLVDPNPPGGGWSGLSAALLNTPHLFWQLAHGSLTSIRVTKPAFDWSQWQQGQNEQTEKAAKVMQAQLDRHQVEVVKGRGWFLAENEARVESEYEVKRYLFDHAVIAVGGEAAAWPGLPFDNSNVLTPTQALALAELPPTLTILGADAVAAELATLFAKVGAAVQLWLPAEQRLLPQFEPAAGEAVKTGLQALGVNIANLTTPEALSGLVVVSAGLTARTTELGLDKAKVAAGADGFIEVNERQQTSNPIIYAAGAVTGGAALSYVAAKQGKVAAENIAGKIAQFAPQAIPHVAWTEPEVAAVGLTATEAENAGYNVLRFSTLTASPSPTHRVEIVAEKESEVLLGVIIIGPQAELLIGEAAFALEMGATLTDLAETLHPAPGAALSEAAEAALKT